MKKILLSSLIAVMAVSAANAKIASTEYVDATKTAAIEAAATDATTKANAAETAAISAAAADATSKANQALADAKTYTNTEITSLTTGAIKTNTEDIAGIKQSMESMATNETVTNLKNKLDILEGADTTAGSVRQLIKAANDAQDTTLKAYADQAEADAIATADTNATTAISDALKDYSTTNEIATTYAPISTTYTKGEVDNLVNVKANSADVYTKTDANSTFATKLEAEAASTAAAAAQSKADAAVVANNAITAGTGTKITYDAKGLVTGSASLEAGDIPTLSIEQISGLQDALNSKQATLTIDTELKTDSTNAVENKAIATAINAITTSNAMTSGIDSTKVGQIETNRTAIATNTTNIATNTTNIATNTTAINSIKTAEAGAFADDTTAYVLTATRDTNGVLQYKWEEIDRTVLSNN